MRFAYALAVLLIVAVVSPVSAAPTPPPPSIEITAQNIALYTDRRVLIADAGVAVVVGTRSLAAAHAVVYLNEGRAVLSGGVTMKEGGVTSTGPSYTLDIETGIGKFLDATSTNDVGGTSPVVTSQRVVIRPNESMTFTPAVVGQGGAQQTVASYIYPLAAPHSRDFGPSPAIGAAIDYPFIIARGRNGYVFGTGRYDKYFGGFGAGIEGHVATSERGYASAAITQDGDGARYDLLAFQSIRDGLNQTLNGSAGIGLRYARYALTSFGRTGTLQMSLAQNGMTHSDDLYASTNRAPLGGGWALRLDGDLGRDSHPVDYPINEDGRASVGGVLDGPTWHVVGVSLSTQAVAGGTAYSYGRRSFDQGASTFASRTFGPLSLSASAAILQSNDEIGLYPRGTFRTYTVSGYLATHAPWNIFTSIQYAHDYPQFVGYGRPQFLQTIALRIHRKHGVGVEIDTSFAYGNTGLMPRPTLSISLLH